MTKAELVETIFESGTAGETRAEAERAVAAVLAAIARGLKRDRKVQISGFGAFSVRKRAPRVVKNPRTGVRVSVPARRTVSFRAGQRLRSDVIGEGGLTPPRYPPDGGATRPSPSAFGGGDPSRGGARSDGAAT